MKNALIDETKTVLEIFYKIPFIIQKINKYLNKIYDKYKSIQYLKLHENYGTYMDYYKNEWESYLINGFLNYAYLKKEQRSNSYLENYNRRIKQKLSNFLYGKNKCRISWPLLLYFLIQEENEYRNNIYNKEINIDIKNMKLEKFVKTEKIDKSKDKEKKKFKENNTIVDDNKFLKWNFNSCLYDSFFSYIYSVLDIIY